MLASHCKLLTSSGISGIDLFDLCLNDLSLRFRSLLQRPQRPIFPLKPSVLFSVYILVMSTENPNQTMLQSLRIENLSVSPISFHN